MEDNELIQRFIESEEYALSNNVQGDFYPSYWHKITPIQIKALKNIADKDKIQFFFHLFYINNGPGFIPHKKNFTLYKKAFIQLLELSKSRVSSTIFDELKTVVLFDAHQSNDGEIRNIYTTSYDDFKINAKILKQCDKYSYLSAMCKKHEKFIPLAQNPYIVNRCIAAIKKVGSNRHAPIPNKDFLFWGLILILVLNKSKEAMVTLLELIRISSCREYMYVFGEFLDLMPANMNLSDLNNALYEHHPKEWIDVRDENWIQNYYTKK